MNPQDLLVFKEQWLYCVVRLCLLFVGWNIMLHIEFVFKALFTSTVQFRRSDGGEGVYRYICPQNQSLKMESILCTNCSRWHQAASIYRTLVCYSLLPVSAYLHLSQSAHAPEARYLGIWLIWIYTPKKSGYAPGSKGEGPMHCSYALRKQDRD